MRAIWSGEITFGLVNVPVKLYSATSPKSVRFHQLSRDTGARIKQKRVDPSTGEEVPFEEIVKQYYGDEVQIKTPLSREDAGGISIAKAEGMLGYSPKRSWRDYLDGEGKLKPGAGEGVFS